MNFGHYKARKNLSAELGNGACSNFTKDGLYYLETVYGGYFVRDDFGQLVKLSKEEFEDTFEIMKYKNENTMTNHEKLSKITRYEETVEIEAVKMLLSKISDDYRNELYEQNESAYLDLYKEQVKWLNSKIDN